MWRYFQMARRTQKLYLSEKAREKLRCAVGSPSWELQGIYYGKPRVVKGTRGKEYTQLMWLKGRLQVQVRVKKSTPSRKTNSTNGSTSRGGNSLNFRTRKSLYA